MTTPGRRLPLRRVEAAVDDLRIALGGADPQVDQLAQHGPRRPELVLVEVAVQPGVAERLRGFGGSQVLHHNAVGNLT